MEELDLNRWRRGDQRAPHKPLLLLLAMGAWKNQRILQWKDVKQELGSLIEQFSTSHRKSASYPFIRLQADGYWQVEGFEDQKGDAQISELNRRNPIGRISIELEEKFQQDTRNFDLLLNAILSEFPEALHTDLLEQVQISRGQTIPEHGESNNRDPDFRRVVLNAYDYQCAICGYGGRIDHMVAGVEAGHIKWHAYDGPDTVDNGLALCSMHHKLFDLGSFGILPDFNLIISSRANGPGMPETLEQHLGRRIRTPRNDSESPNGEYLAWHRKEVFKS